MTERALEVRNRAGGLTLLGALATLLVAGGAHAQGATSAHSAASPPPAATPAQPEAPVTTKKPEAPTATNASATDPKSETAVAAKPAPAPAVSPEPLPLLGPQHGFVPTQPAKPARAEDPEASETKPDDGKMGTHRDHWIATLGTRINYISNEGLDPFSTDDVLAQFSVAAGRTVYGDGNFALAALLAWDMGGTSAEARGDKSKFYSHRVTLGGEGRYHFWRRFYGFGRLAPGAVRWDASLQDDSVGYTREAGNWMFALDLSAGAAFEFAGEASGDSASPRGWVSAEGGYGWTTSSEVRFTGDETADVPARVEPLAFNDIALRGGYFRIAATLTY